MIELSVSIAGVPLEAIMSQGSVLENFKVDFFHPNFSFISLCSLDTEGRIRFCCLLKGIPEAVFLAIFL